MQLLEMDHLVSLPSITGHPPPMLTGTESDLGDEITAGVVKNQIVQFCWPWNLCMQSSYTLGGEMEH